jgi:type IV pilus assembly protein PilC
MNKEPRLSRTDRIMLAKRLAYLTRAGIPLMESVHMLEADSSANTTAILRSIGADLENGSPLARALARFPRTFSGFEVAIVRMGEASGMLSSNLEYLAEELRKADMLRKKLLGSLAYPAVIAIATLLITGFLTLYLFPRIMPVFLSLRIELPITTRAVIALSSFLMHWGVWLALAFAGMVLALTIGIRRNTGVRMRCASLALATPLIGPLLKSYHLATALRTLGRLLGSGMPLSEAAALTARAVQHPLYQRAYENLESVIARGERISQSLGRTPTLFPAIVVQMIAVGERSGTLSDTLLYLAELYETEVDDRTRILSTLMEPALMILMGIVVGFIAVSIIAPIYGITDHLHA